MKKAKAAKNNVEELKKKLPDDLVEGCTKELAARKAQEEETQRLLAQQLNQQQHDTDKQTNPSHHFEMSSKLGSRSSSPLPSVDESERPTDFTPLLERRSSFGSQSEHSTGGGTTMKRQNSWGSFGHTVFKVTSYLGLADDKQIFYKALEDVDEKLDMFRTAYDEEVQKVKDFYEDKLHEIGEHIEAIIESVDTSHIKQHPKKNRTSSLIDELVTKFESVMHNRKLSDNIPSIRTTASVDSAEDIISDTENPNIMKLRSQSSSDKLDIERESDSIKRALTDVYRNAKMLHNYSIMVCRRL